MVVNDSGIWQDKSLWSLVASNILTLILAVTLHWSLLTIMWIYWCQSVIIGFFNVIRILKLKTFSAKNLKLNNIPVEKIKLFRNIPTLFKVFVACFFAFHYGFFHLVYAVFLSVGTIASLYGSAVGFPLPFGHVAFFGVLFSAGVFFINHLFSFIYNSKKDEGLPDIGRLMFYPYARIIPMHITIIIGVLLGPMALPFFLVLKTIADVVMHAQEHAVSVGSSFFKFSS